MSLWIEMPIASLDTETTGLDMKTARVIEIGIACYVNGKQENTYSQLVDPQEPIPPKITEITKITSDDLKGKPVFADIADDVMKCLENRIFLAYNAPYDLGMLRAEFKRLNRPFPELKVLDPLVLAREVLSLKGYKLGAVAKYLKIDMERAHRALDDAAAAAEIMYKIGHLLPSDLNELLNVQEQWKNAQDAKRRQWQQRRSGRPDVLTLNTSTTQDNKLRLGPAYIYTRETNPDPVVAFIKDYASRVGNK